MFQAKATAGCFVLAVLPGISPMTHDDMANLFNVYQTLDPDAATQSTTYILQFLWRDLTSSNDVVGPYYTSKGAFESKFIIGVVMKTVKLYYTCMVSIQVYWCVTEQARTCRQLKLLWVSLVCLVVINH